ncbi:gamma-glutamyltransferase [Nonomuraea thailandensis]
MRSSCSASSSRRPAPGCATWSDLGGRGGRGLVAAPALVAGAYPHHVHNTRYAPSGMVCSVDHLASAAGLTMLERGGSAADAAIATNAVLAVVAPHMCGLGGDLFALVHEPARRGGASALNASGRAGSGADPARLRAEGHTRMPHLHDVRSVPVPGCVDGWAALHARHGRLPLAELLAPAIRLADHGFPASPLMLAGAVAAARRPAAPTSPPCAPPATASPGRASRGRCARWPSAAGTASIWASSGRAWSSWAPASTPRVTWPCRAPTGSSR